MLGKNVKHLTLEATRAKDQADYSISCTVARERSDTAHFYPKTFNHPSKFRGDQKSVERELLLRADLGLLLFSRILKPQENVFDDYARFRSVSLSRLTEEDLGKALSLTDRFIKNRLKERVKEFSTIGFATGLHLYVDPRNISESIQEMLRKASGLDDRNSPNQPFIKSRGIMWDVIRDQHAEIISTINQKTSFAGVFISDESFYQTLSLQVVKLLVSEAQYFFNERVLVHLAVDLIPKKRTRNYG